MARSLTIMERIVVFMFNMMLKLQGGGDMGIVNEAFIELHGVRGYMEHIQLWQAIFDEVSAEYGAYEGQVLVSFAAFFNGCRFCSIGHLKAASLILYRDEGLLSPVDEGDLVELMYATDMDALQILLEKLEGDRFEVLRGALEDVFSLRFGMDPTSNNHHLLLAMIGFWEWTNECTINMGIDRTTENMFPLAFNPSRKLVREYETARKAQRASRSS